MSNLGIFSFLIFAIFFLSTFPLALSIYSPVDNFLISSGAAAATSYYNRNFLPDDHSPIVGTDLLFYCRSTAVTSTSKSLRGVFHLHQTARVFSKPSKYVFIVKDRGFHIVRLHFFPFVSSDFNLGDARFHVLIDGNIALRNFSAPGSLTIKEYIVPAHLGKLRIEFLPIDNRQFAFVNAIEVFSAPNSLIPDETTLVNGNRQLELTNQTLETVHRINVGGPLVNAFNDTLWRTWTPDDEFFQSGENSKKVYFSGRIHYIKGGASREVAPDFVYNTARVISSGNDSVSSAKMSWEFPIVKGYKYFVRLHFCDIASIALYLINFNVYIDGTLVAERVDLSSIWNTLASPAFKDFAVESSSSEILRVDIGPSNESVAHNIDGILNGLEIMKMSTMGSLEDELFAEIALRKWQRKRQLFVQLFAVVCLLLGALAFVYRRKVVRKDDYTWIRLPISHPDSTLKQMNVNTVSKV